jgi:hypothetical protein
LLEAASGFDQGRRLMTYYENFESGSTHASRVG